VIGALNSLSQITLKATMPGVPDFYQGTEYWDFSLVDPDNRRPVDFAGRTKALQALQEPAWGDLAQTWRDSRLKLAWTHRLLRLRTELHDVFTDGDYRPLTIKGPLSDHAIAFARTHGADAAIVVVSKIFAPLTDQGRHWPRSDAFDAAVEIPGLTVEGAEGELALRDLFRDLPVAVIRAKVAQAARLAKPRRKARA
jgi:(1->4)-alpha-D-glucan 1-alpha-D-glucosylmutase